MVKLSDRPTPHCEEDNVAALIPLDHIRFFEHREVQTDFCQGHADTPCDLLDRGRLHGGHSDDSALVGIRQRRENITGTIPATA